MMQSKMTRLVRLLGPAACLALALGCGKPPQPIQTTASGPRGGMPTMPEGHPPIDGGGGGGAMRPAPVVDDGHDHDPNVKFAGTIELAGELATATSGFLFVSIKPEGIAMPSYSRKYSLTDPAIDANDAGQRVLHFQLTEGHSLGGLAPGGLVLEARFDPDGWVDTKEGQVTAIASIDPGEQHAHLTLP